MDKEAKDKIAWMAIGAGVLGIAYSFQGSELKNLLILLPDFSLTCANEIR